MDRIFQILAAIVVVAAIMAITSAVLGLTVLAVALAGLEITAVIGSIVWLFVAAVKL